MDGFFIALISFFGGLVVDRIIISCRRGSAKNNNNSGNSPDNHDEEKRENVENSITEVKQNGQKIETDKDKHMKFYDEMDQKLKILNKKADEVLEANKASKSEVLISNETNDPKLN